MRHPFPLNLFPELSSLNLGEARHAARVAFNAAVKRPIVTFSGLLVIAGFFVGFHFGGYFAGVISGVLIMPIHFANILANVGKVLREQSKAA